MAGCRRGVYAVVPPCKQMANGGCHEGDAGGPADGRRYAVLLIPDHSPALVDYLREWASDSRAVGYRPTPNPVLQQPAGHVGVL